MPQSYGVDKKGRAGDVVEVVATGGAPVVLGAGRTVHHRGDRMVIKLAHCKGHWGISRWVRQFHRLPWYTPVIADVFVVGIGKRWRGGKHASNVRT